MGWADVKPGAPDIIPMKDPHTGEDLVEPLNEWQQRMARELGWFRRWLLTTKRQEDV